MLTALRNWSKRFLDSRTPKTETQHRASAERAREVRADTVNRLRDEIHRIQHDISVLNDEIQGAGDPRPADVERMASLHRELATKQRELGTYQARI